MNYISVRPLPHSSPGTGTIQCVHVAWQMDSG